MLNIVSIVITAVVIMLVLSVLFIVICVAASPKDRTDENIEQMNFLKRYLKGKDEKD